LVKTASRVIKYFFHYPQKSTIARYHGYGRSRYYRIQISGVFQHCLNAVRVLSWYW